VDLNNFDAFENAELVVPDTKALKAKLGPLSDNITIKLETGSEDASTRIVSMNIMDSELEQIYKTGDGDHLPSKPKLISIPSYDVEIKLNEEFITRFIKVKSAAPDVSNFTLIMNPKKKKLEMILGYSSNNNTDRSILNLNCVEGKDALQTPTSFSANVLKEILSANSEVKEAVFKVSEQGLAHIEFVSDDFISKYYLIKIPVEE
jgi:hypothetical protein